MGQRACAAERVPGAWQGPGSGRHAPGFTACLPAAAAPARPRRCQLIQGTPVLKGGSGYSEHVWVAKDELAEYIQQPQLLDLLQKML